MYGQYDMWKWWTIAYIDQMMPQRVVFELKKYICIKLVFAGFQIYDFVFLVCESIKPNRQNRNREVEIRFTISSFLGGSLKRNLQNWTR